MVSTQTAAHTHTHTHLMALCPGLPGWAGTRKVKPIWIYSWAICKSAPCSRQINMPAPHHSVFYRPDGLPNAQPTVSKHWRYKTATHSGDELKSGLAEWVDCKARGLGSGGGGPGQLGWHHHVGWRTGPVSDQQRVTQEMSYLGEAAHRCTVRVLHELLQTSDNISINRTFT